MGRVHYDGNTSDLVHSGRPNVFGGPAAILLTPFDRLTGRRSHRLKGARALANGRINQVIMTGEFEVSGENRGCGTRELMTHERWTRWMRSYSKVLRARV
jgi:hypothetical protein